MKANLQIVNLLLRAAQQLLTAPDKDLQTAAGEEMQELLRRRQKLLQRQAKDAPSQEAAVLTAVASH